VTARYDSRVTSPSLTRHRKTFFAPIWLFGTLAALAFVSIIGAFVYSRSVGTTTIVLVRHAEKQLGTIDDPPLAPAGELRAERLAAMFGDREPLGRLQAIYVTSKRRSQQTAAPVARRLGLTPIVADEPSDVLANRILREQRGRIVLVVGHSNTVPELVRLLTDLSAVPAINEADEYDTMYWVSVPAMGTASVVRVKY
jgi:phosphohistidine phosphatase SixA